MICINKLYKNINNLSNFNYLRNLKKVGKLDKF